MSMLDAIAIALLLAAAPTNGTAPRDEAARAAEADALRDAARRSFDEGRFAEAAQQLEDLYAIDPRPEYLYSRGQALRLAGDCAGAIGALDAFLATEPPRADVEDAEQWIARCREHLGEDEAAEPDPEPPPPVIATPPVDDAPPARPWHRDPTGGVLLGLGLAGIATGAGLVGGSFALANADRSEGQAEHFDRQHRVDRFAAAGWSVLGIGTALAIGAAIRYAIVHRRSR